MTKPAIELPAHIEQTIEAITQFDVEHHSRASTAQRTVAGLITFLGRPAFTVTVVALVVAWAVLNFGLIAAGRPPIDEPPFFWLQGLVALSALLMTSLILTTQRRDDELASLRAQLTLELSILSEQKSAKIIELLEELRRDSPSLKNRIDDQASEFSTPADPQTVLDAIRESASGAAPER